MEPRSPVKEKFFIVVRGKSRKGFSRGCVGRVEAETPRGELMGLLYGAGSPRSGGVVRKEDTYPLSRHQAQLLLYVSSSSRRLELLCNLQLFSAICELSQEDLVLVKYKKGHLPALVKNLMQIGRKEDKEDLNMLAFELEFVDAENSLSSKKATPLPLFSAADIIQVVPSSSVPRWRDSQSGPSKKAVTRINSMPNIGTRARQATEGLSRVPETPLDVGSLVEVSSNKGVTVYGVIRWLGVPAGKSGEWAGIELDYDVKGCSDGSYGGQRFFTCTGNRGLFVPMSKCSPDSRFTYSPAGPETPRSKPPPPVPPYEDSGEDAGPVSESEAVSLFVGKMKGIQGHVNSCYLDATLFSLFSCSVTLDHFCQRPDGAERPITCTLRRIVNRLRRQGFVPAESVMKLRTLLGCETFQTQEKDPEELITGLFQKALCMDPLLKLRSKHETSQGAYTFQIFLEKEQLRDVPTVQQLMDTSCLSCDLKFEEMPSCLMVQMPRFGNKYKMFSHIIPSMDLDLTDLLSSSLRECFLCGQTAEHECLQCLPDPKLQPGRIKQFCSTCNSQVHKHPSRQGHVTSALTLPAQTPTEVPAGRRTMKLFAVLCIHTSHYVSFVKYGSDPSSWLFFDSMADRCGDDRSGYNIPEIRSCPEVGDLLSRSEDELGRVDPAHTPELVRRLLCDSYMFLYQAS